MEEIKLEDCPIEIQKLITSDSTSIRTNFVLTCDIKYLPSLINDKDWVVRSYLSDRIDVSYLPQMMNDENSNVRFFVSERIDISYLPQMLKDKDWEVVKNSQNRIRKMIKNIKCNICSKKYSQLLEK